MFSVGFGCHGTAKDDLLGSWEVDPFVEFEIFLGLGNGFFSSRSQAIGIYFAPWSVGKDLARLKDAAQLALKKMPSSEQEAISQVGATFDQLLDLCSDLVSTCFLTHFCFILWFFLQSEYQRGVSAWNFDIEDLKSQASLVLLGSSSLRKSASVGDCLVQPKPVVNARFAISICTARYGRYIPVRQVTSMRTARYWVKNLLSTRRPRPRAVVALARGCFFSRARRQNVSLRGEKDRGDPPGQHPKEISHSNPKEFGNSSVPASIVMPHLQNLFQQTSFQRDLLVSLLNSLQQNEIVDVFPSGMPSQAQNLKNEKLV
ncbi:hypothetical protein BHM03_00024004, partial [Ensete ventricosum]